MSLLQDLRLSRAPLAAFAALGVIWGAFAGMVPASKAMLGLDDAHWGWMLMAASCGAISSMMLAPRLGQALGARALPLTVAVLGLVYMIPGQLPWPIFFAVAMAMVGATAGMVDVLMNARVSAIEAEAGRPLMNLNHAAYSFTYAATAGLTGLARAAGAGPGLVLALGGALVLALSFACREPGGEIGALGRRARPALALGLLPLIGGAVIFLGFVAENAAEQWSALHIERTLHAPPGTGSIGPALLALTMGIGRISGQVVAARLSEDRLLRLAVGLTALGALITALALNLWMAYLGLMVMGLGVSVVVPTAFALIGRLLPAELRARGIARASVFGYLGFFIGPPILGALSEVLGLRAAFGMVAVLVVLILPLLPLLLRAR